MLRVVKNTHSDVRWRRFPQRDYSPRVLREWIFSTDVMVYMWVSSSAKAPATEQAMEPVRNSDAQATYISLEQLSVMKKGLHAGDRDDSRR